MGARSISNGGLNLRNVRLMELFSGAGGFTASLSDGIFEVTDAFDSDGVACMVYGKNRPTTRLHNVDITSVREFSAVVKPPDILIAGPPCQGFSIVGMKTKRALSEAKRYDPSTDPRNLLPLEIPRVATQLRPKAVIMENVPAMRGHVISIGKEEKSISDLIVAGLEDAGYSVSGPVLVDAQDFGVAQKRKRAFILAARDADIGGYEIQSILSRLGGPSLHTTLRAAIGDLALLRARPPREPRQNQEPPDHVARIPNVDDIKIIRALRPGEDYASLIERMPDILVGRTHKAYRTDSFRDKFYRMSWDAPSRTIVAHLQKDGNSFIHPSLDRSISVREAARIQSFPDRFVFGVPMGHAYRLVGNAVPPIVGKVLVEMLSKIAGLVGAGESKSMEFASLVD